MSKIGFTFNWFYADDRDIGYFNSGDNPVRAAGVEPAVPDWGTGEWDWQGFDPADPTHRPATYTAASPASTRRSINQGYLTSWNNKQAPGFGAADSNWRYGPMYRSQMLDRRIERRHRRRRQGQPARADRRDGGRRHRGPARRARSLPWMLNVIGQPGATRRLADAVATLQLWLYNGAHRRDKDKDGSYEDERAVQIMDAWWPRPCERPDVQAGARRWHDLFDKISGELGLDNEPNNHGAHLGSAYQDGWYGYVEKDLRRLLGEPVAGRALAPVLRQRQASPTAVTALVASLTAALAVHETAALPGQRLHRTATRPASTRSASAPSARVTVPSIPWINRPTLQQVVEVQGTAAAEPRSRTDQEHEGKTLQEARADRRGPRVQRYYGLRRRRQTQSPAGSRDCQGSALRPRVQARRSIYGR